jgi:hypothetical protein
LLFLFVSPFPFPLHLWILKVDAKVIVMTAKIAKATKAANTAKIAKNIKQTKIMKAGNAGPFHIRKDKSIHRLTDFAKEIEMMIFWAVRVGRVGCEVSRQIFLKSDEGGGWRVAMMTRREEKYALCADESPIVIGVRRRRQMYDRK